MDDYLKLIKEICNGDFDKFKYLNPSDQLFWHNAIDYAIKNKKGNQNLCKEMKNKFLKYKLPIENKKTVLPSDLIIKILKMRPSSCIKLTKGEIYFIYSAALRHRFRGHPELASGNRVKLIIDKLKKVEDNTSPFCYFLDIKMTPRLFTNWNPYILKKIKETFKERLFIDCDVNHKVIQIKQKKDRHMTVRYYIFNMVEIGNKRPLKFYHSYNYPH